MSELCGITSRRITFALDGEMSIIVYGPERWTDDDFRELCERMKQMRDGRNVIGSISISAHHTISATQRRIAMTADPAAIKNLRYLVGLSDSALTRAAGTALALLLRNTELKMFRPIAYRAALAWLRERCTFDLAGAEEACRALVRDAGYKRPILDEDWKDSLRKEA